MNGSTLNFGLISYWADCYVYYNYQGSLPKIGIPTIGILIFYITVFFEFIVGVPSNLWLICHILKKRSKSTGIHTGDFFPFHVSLTQLFSFLNVPVLIVSHFIRDQKVMLLAMETISTAMLVTKPLLYCMTCLETYTAVVRPTIYLRFKAKKYKWGWVALTWFIFALLACITSFGSIPSARCALFPFVLVADTFCCLSIFYTLKKPPPGDKTMMAKAKGKKVKNMSGELHEETKERRERAACSEPRAKQENHSLKRKALVTMVIIQFVLTINYFPFILVMSLERRTPPRSYKCELIPLALAAASSCTYLQPLLYLKSLGKLPFTKPRNMLPDSCFAHL